MYKVYEVNYRGEERLVKVFDNEQECLNFCYEYFKYELDNEDELDVYKNNELYKVF